MTTSVIITLCILLLLAYVFDLSSSKTKIPSVILLLLLGWLVKQGTRAVEVEIPDLTGALPILGTVGLILIVLEGALELDLTREKLPVIGKSAFISLVPMLLFSFALAWVFQMLAQVQLKIGLANALPLAIISSAIAIPSSKNLSAFNREFITYESSLSDIFGVILFNFITLNDNIGSASVGMFILQLVIILIVTFIATVGLSYLLSRINHHVKFIPIILIIVLIYAVSKVFHLPALIFILLFGLFLGNLDRLKHIKYIRMLKPDKLDNEVHKFKDLITEIAFLIRALFFLLFGYLVETRELLNSDTILLAVGITAGIFILRFLFLKLFRFSTKPLVFIAPRGLITILLFLSIPVHQSMNLANKSLVIQVIILSALVMMTGLMTTRETIEQPVNEIPENI